MITNPNATRNLLGFALLHPNGANDFNGGVSSGTLYNWAATDYQFHIWDINKFPETPVYINEEEWLKWLDYMAVKYDKRRPDHLFLLREYGARTSSELSA